MILLLLSLAALPQTATAANEDLVLHFDNDGAELTVKADKELAAFILDVELGPQDEVRVVGYADEKGEFKRASDVRKALIDKLGTAAERVLSVGQGNESPEATSDTDKGLPRNRRVVVRLIGVAPPEIQRPYGGQDPRLVEVDALLGEADAQLRLGHYGDALAKLDRAADLGGDQYSRWHTSYGIIGFFGGQPPHKLRAYFEKALALDPHDSDARDFLGRIEAREAFLEGRVVPYMGRTPRSAIKVTTRSQQHEYLKLFAVEPLSHATLASGTIQIWKCRSGKNREVTYYFDTTSVLERAYSKGDSQS